VDFLFKTILFPAQKVIHALKIKPGTVISVFQHKVTIIAYKTNVYNMS